MRCSIDWQKVNKQLVIKNADESEGYLFKSQLKTVTTICEDMTKNKSSKERDGRMESIIGIVGERGSGKSSLLYTIKETLKQKYFVLEVIDPSAFDDSMSILELYISQIYKKIIESYQERGENSSRSEKILNKVKNILKIVSDSYAEKEFYTSHSYSDILSEIKDRVDMTDLVKELSDLFLDELNEGKKGDRYQGVVLCIDDVDMVSNKKVYKLLEEVRKYLAGNIIVITSYRAMQLFEAVLAQKLNENEDLIDNEAITQDQVRDQVSRYLEKLIPINYRVELHTANRLYNMPCKDVLNDFILKGEDFIFDENQTTKDWIYEQLQSKIRLKVDPVDKYENTIYNLPMNLRGIMQLLDLICNKMRTVEYIEPSQGSGQSLQKNEIAQKIVENLRIYKEHIYQNMSEILPVELSNIVNTWLECDYGEKNYYICNVLLDGIPSKNEQSLDIKNYALYASHNVALSDVYTVLDEYKRMYSLDNKQVYLVYLIKVLYGIELLTYYLQAYLNKEKPVEAGDLEVNLEAYLSLINAKIMPDGFHYGIETGKDEEEQLLGQYNQEAYDVELFKRMIYSTSASESDLRRSLPDRQNGSTKNASKVGSKTYNAWKYSYLYNYDIKGEDLVKGRKYLVDPYSIVAQKRYVQESFECNRYVFYSPFDIDAFVRFRYGTDSEKGFEFFLEHVDHILSHPKDVNKYFVRDHHEKYLWNAIAGSVFFKEGRELVFGSLLKDVDDNCRGKEPIYLDEICLLKNRAMKIDPESAFDLEKINDLEKKFFLNLLDAVLLSNDLVPEEREFLVVIETKLQTSRSPGSKAYRTAVKKIVTERKIVVLNKDVYGLS